MDRISRKNFLSWAAVDPLFAVVVVGHAESREVSAAGRRINGNYMLSVPPCSLSDNELTAD
jgi:hypothetical protein